MTTFYLSANWSRREEMSSHAADLEGLGYRVQARWLAGEEQVHGHEAVRAVEGDGPIPLAAARLFAEDDLVDLLAADVFLAFTDPKVTNKLRGGRHVEYGIALGLRQAKRNAPILVTIGRAENVFHALADKNFATWGEFAPHLHEVAMPLLTNGVLRQSRSAGGAPADKGAKAWLDRSGRLVA